MTAPSPMDLYARPGRRVRVAGRRRLNLQVMGEGSPTVILAAGFLGGPLDWGLVQPYLARSHRTVSFDTAGLGFSDPARGPRTTDAIVDDLHAALGAAGIEGPYVLAGHSAGGLRLRRFAERYPAETAGLVLIDSVIDDWEYRLFGGPCPAIVAERTAFRRMLALARAGRLTPDTVDFKERVGLPREGLSPAVNAMLHAMWTRPSYLRAALSESLNLGTAGAAGPPPAPLGDVPLVVLSAGRIAESGFVETPAQAEAWFAMHDDLTALSTRGSRRTVDCSHNLPVERPRDVGAAIDEVVAMAGL